jgi:hypothetical protein
MKKLAIFLAVFSLMVSSALAAAPDLKGKTFSGTGFGVDGSSYSKMTITVAITSQSGYRFKGTVTTIRNGVTDPNQKFFAVIATDNQIYMVVQDATGSEATNVLVDAKYNTTTGTIKGFWRGMMWAGAGYFTLKEVL